MNTTNSELGIALGVASVLKYALFWILRNRDVKEYVGRVASLSLYPLKSARPLAELRTARLTKHGLKVQGVNDRQWIVTNKGTMVNMTINPKLILIQPTLDGDNIRFEAPEMSPLILPAHPAFDGERVVTLKIAFATQTALDCGDEAAEWISTFLGKPGLRMNCSTPDLPKRHSVDVRKNWTVDARPDEELMFQDFVNCMIINEASVAALNQRLDTPVPAHQFRGNLTIHGAKPFDEDTWKVIYIGESARLRFVDDCQRCVITTVNWDTAVKDERKQPLTELLKFRCKEKYGPQKPVQGVHTNTEVEGEISVGDPVYVIRK